MNKYLYRAGKEQNIKTFYPRKPISSHNNNKNIPLLYATDDISFASGFCFDWSDNEGFKFGKINNNPWTLHVPTKYLYKLEQKCSIYILKQDNFIKLKTKTPEYITYQPTNVIYEIKYKNCLQCLKQNNIILKEIL